MFTSIGYHTFEIAKNLTQEEANLLFEDFKKYMKHTGKIEIIKLEYDNDPLGRHYGIVYLEEHDKGIYWRIRFSNKGHFIDNDFKPCNVKATINPKILTKEKSYIVAADESYLEAVRTIYDQEAAKISLGLRGFYNYSLNRLDYCINFDVSELKLNCPAELKKELPKRIMQLIKCGDIPDKFNEEYKKDNQFYLQSKSVVINCYWKYAELQEDFSDCIDLEKSYDIIRFEVQYRYRKAREQSKAVQKAYTHQNFISRNGLKGERYDEEQDKIEDKEKQQLQEVVTEIARLPKAVALDAMLSDQKCNEVIEKYYNNIIKSGDYYTLDNAKRIIEAETSGWEKTVRLTDTLKRIHDYGGISKVKRTLQGKELEDFRRSLRELAKLGINPVTIPKEWGIEFIPNLLDNFYRLRREEWDKEKEEKENRQMLIDYVKECKKLGKSWLL